MVWKELRERLVFMAMSAFVVWHAIAIMIAPASDNSVLVQSAAAGVRPLPVAVQARTTNGTSTRRTSAGAISCATSWKAPTGIARTFTPTDGWSWHHPGYWWFRAWNDAIIASPDLYADRVIATLCRTACGVAADGDHAPAASSSRTSRRRIISPAGIRWMRSLSTKARSSTAHVQAHSVQAPGDRAAHRRHLDGR